jgi:hypothetical protein
MDTDKDLRKALAKVLVGIESEWKISSAEFGQLLHVTESMFLNWKSLESIDATDLSFERVIRFIDFYDTISSLFAKVEDQIGFLNSTSEEFNFKSPFELIKDRFDNIMGIQFFID